MTIPHPHDRRTTPTRRLRKPWKSLRCVSHGGPPSGLFRRHPLLRASDRIEALVPAPAVMLLLLAAPVAATVGAAVHDSRRDADADAQQHHHNRALVTATITDDHNGTLTDEPIPTSNARVNAVTTA